MKFNLVYQLSLAASVVFFVNTSHAEPMDYWPSQAFVEKYILKSTQESEQISLVVVEKTWMDHVTPDYYPKHRVAIAGFCTSKIGCIELFDETLGENNSTAIHQDRVSILNQEVGTVGVPTIRDQDMESERGSVKVTLYPIVFNEGVTFTSKSGAPLLTHLLLLSNKYGTRKLAKIVTFKLPHSKSRLIICGSALVDKKELKNQGKFYTVNEWPQIDVATRCWK